MRTWWLLVGVVLGFIAGGMLLPTYPNTTGKAIVMVLCLSGGLFLGYVLDVENNPARRPPSGK